jgi:serine/threonine protein kinase
LFPGYAITGLIACGGMGAVYQAVQRSLERVVAIKILPREFSRDAEFREGFQAEARAMARLNHPNLISVYDSGEVDGMLYIVMEFVEGESLYHASYGIRVDPREAARLVASICDGLAHAHEHGILHRDIKPANILLTPKAEPKIGDFGLARPIGLQQGANETVFGTPHYTAPEVLSHPAAVDARADIFSIGVVLHQLLTGNVPAADPRPASVIARCDMRFDEIIRKATNPVPSMRYASASALAQDLHVLSNSIGIATNFIPVAQVSARAPMRRAAAPVARTVVVKKSGGGFVTALALIAIAAAAIYFVKKPGGLQLNILLGGEKSAEVQTEDAGKKKSGPYIANMQGGAVPSAADVDAKEAPASSNGKAANPFGTVTPPKP